MDRARRFAAAGAIRRARPAAALLLTDSLSSAILAFLAGARERIGYGGEGRDLLLTRRVARAGAPRTSSRVSEYRRLGEAAGLQTEAGMPRLRALPGEEAAAREIRSARSVPGRYAVLAPGASYGPAKQWPAERFADVARALEARSGLVSLLVGGAEDRPVTSRVAGAAGPAAIDLAGATDLPALFGLLAGSEVVVSNDSGVMHVAAALGRPTVAVFGSTSPVWTSTGSPRVRNLYAAYPCSPCFRRTCPIGYGCLSAVGFDAAVHALESLGALAPPHGPPRAPELP